MGRKWSDNPAELQLELALSRLREGKRRRRYWIPVALAGALCFAALHFWIGVSLVSGISMSPALLSGDVVVYDRLAGDIRVGDVVVVLAENQVDMIKRVVAVAGDTISVLPDGHITRNGQVVYEPAVWYGWQESRGWVSFPLTVPSDSYFCMGDNRAISLDSRSTMFGAISRAEIGGKVLLTIRRQ